jgi:cytoskeletal protein CcmA (bactofilin family)
MFRVRGFYIEGADVSDQYLLTCGKQGSAGLRNARNVLGPASRRFYLQQRGTPLTVALNKNQVEDQATSLVPANATESLTIRKSMRIKGEVIGSESLVIEGKVEGIIRVPNCRVTVGQHAEVFADIAAREVIVFGRVLGNVDASDRVDLRSEASLTGLVTTKRIQITEGAYFHGALNIIAQGQG